MHEATWRLFLADVAFWDIWRYVSVLAAPVLGIIALWWLINQADRMVAWFFPYAEWEKSLGWLDIRAERQSNTALRWLGYFIYALLAVALLGIGWAAQGLAEITQWSDPSVLSDLALRMPVLLFCGGLWMLYFGTWLIPRLRKERQETGLKKFRATLDEFESEREMHSISRVTFHLHKPRTNRPSLLSLDDQSRKRR